MQTAISLIGSIGGILIIYSKIDSVNGWEFYDSIMVAGMFMLVQGIKSLFIEPSLSSISGLGGDLWTGNFDFILMKPIPSRLYISIKNWDPIAFIDIAISIIIIIISVRMSGYSVSLKGFGIFCFIIFLGFILLYSIMVIFASVAFWYLGTPLLWIFNSIMEMGRYPVNFYPRIIRIILTWVLPIGFI
ncbi:MAG: ABC transporter permease, partial [Lachnospiraceae bacterium]|nr:ABC transporter permease [Lachnospiraceae bacterium]